MNKDEFAGKIQEIRASIKDETKVTELLTDIFDNTNNLYNTVENLSSSNKELEKANENLRSTNMKLFLKIGETSKNDDPEDPEKDEPKKRSFDDLFNEKGGLK